MMDLFDSHAHLDHPRFAEDREQILSGLAAAGVNYVMNVGCDVTSSVRSVALAKERPGFFAAVGTHPDTADRFSEADLALYRTLAKEPVVRAIGEIGLDYHYPDGPGKADQMRCFAAQLELARELDLPVILHEREAHGDAMDILRQFPEVTGVFHCFSGSPEMAADLVRRGWYLGFTGVVTFHNARKAVETAESIPLDRILIETDCPYMAPEPYRGQRCDSRMIGLTAARMAEIRGISPEELAGAATENAKRLFRIE